MYIVFGRKMRSDDKCGRRRGRLSTMGKINIADERKNLLKKGLLNVIISVVLRII